MTNDQANYYSGITSITVNGKNAYELKGKFLDDLHKNALSVVVFPISLVGDAWRWFDRIKGSITSWVDLTGNFFIKYYPPSRTGGINNLIIKWDPTNPKFENWLASKFVNYKTMDIFTKGALWNYWKLGSDESKPTNDETSDLEETGHDNEQEIVYDDTNHDHEYEMDHEVDERQEICSDETHELLVCNIRRFEMIKYLFEDDEEYVAVKEDGYDDLTSTSKDACQAYQEIFHMIDEGWMVTRDE
ncbi:hypothetical protein Tco_1175960 [Tanacetum coccineum]